MGEAGWHGQRDRSVDDFIASLDDERTVEDSETLIEMMRGISGHEPTLWNVGTIGFGTYHYKYDSGREGDGHTIGFYPRKGKLTIYLMDGTARTRTAGRAGQAFDDGLLRLHPASQRCGPARARADTPSVIRVHRVEVQGGADTRDPVEGGRLALDGCPAEAHADPGGESSSFH